MPIRVISLDFDGCIFNSRYHFIDKNIITSNKEFLDYLIEDNKKFSTVFLQVGSNRQSKYLDYIGSKQSNTDSCFYAIRAINTYLGTNFAPLLIADIFGDLPEGTSYNRVMSYSLLQEKHSCYIGDNGKLAILYAQMHSIAMAHPDEEIVFDFFDDRLDILWGLHTFFVTYPQMIPKNVRLQLNQYAGDAIECLEECPGTGPIDVYYRQTVIDMIELAGNDLCLMPVEEVLKAGFTRCYIWDKGICSYITEEGKLQHNIPLQDIAQFTIIDELKKENNTNFPGNKRRFNKKLIDQLINKNSVENPVTIDDINAGLHRQCVTDITPTLLAHYRDTYKTAIYTELTLLHQSNVFTRKSHNLQAELDAAQKHDDTTAAFNLYGGNRYCKPNKESSVGLRNNFFKLHKEENLNNIHSNSQSSCHNTKPGSKTGRYL